MAENRNNPPKLTEEQQDGHRVATRGMNKNGMRRALQIAASRQVGAYERQHPTCLNCGGPRGRTFGLKCMPCLEAELGA